MATFKEPKEGWPKNTVHVENNEWVIRKHFSNYTNTAVHWIYHYHPDMKSSGGGIRYSPGFHRINGDNRCSQCERRTPKHVLALLHLIC